MIRVLIAEDSPTIRELLVGILESDPGIQVIGHARNGVEAVEMTARLKPDLITMDIHMPLMDGFEATKEIMVASPTPIIVVSGSVSRHDIDLSLSATRVGALMVVEKPGRPDSPGFDAQRERLLSMVKAMTEVKVVRQRDPAAAARATNGSGGGTPRPGVRVIAVAASTGGPAALQRMLVDIPRDFPVPILVVQHIATGFVAGLARWLGSGCSLRVKVAEDGEPLVGRTVFLAPEDRHLGVGQDRRILISDTRPINGFRPSATFLFDSVARAYGTSMVGVILTGMGNDGVDGLKVARGAGATILAQDEASSIVYGMPREAVDAGVVNAVVSIGDLGPRLTHLVAGGHP